MKKTKRTTETVNAPEAVATENGGTGFFAKWPWVLPVILTVYVALLALGTVGEVFHVQWILDLPIFKGP